MGEKYVAVMKDGYLYIGWVGAKPATLQMLRSIGAEPAGYKGLEERALADPRPGMFAILRKSGRFSLVGTLPSEVELDKMLSTTEDEMHVWSHSGDRPRDGNQASVVAAVIRQFLESGGSKETLHALVDSM